MPRTGTPSSRRRGSKRGAFAVYVLSGPPERMRPLGSRARTRPTGVSPGKTWECTRRPRTRRAMSCVVWAPKSKTTMVSCAAMESPTEPNGTGSGHGSPQPGAQSPRGSVPEVPAAREEHADPQAVGDREDLGIALRTAGLDDDPHSRFGQALDAVGEREEGVGSGDAPAQVVPRVPRLAHREIAAIDAAHLAGADAEGAAIAADDDGVGAHVLRHDPEKGGVLALRGRRLRPGRDLHLPELVEAVVAVLHEQRPMELPRRQRPQVPGF